MFQTELGRFDVTPHEWGEILCIFQEYKAFPYIETLRRNDNEVLSPEDCDGLTQEDVDEVNVKLCRIGMLVRLLPNGTRGRFEYPRFVRLG